jgi:hypothetical protein
VCSLNLFDKIHIGAWVAPPPGNFNGLKNDNFINKTQYTLIKLSGIETIYGLYENGTIDQNQVLEALKFADEESIGYLLRDDRIKDGFNENSAALFKVYSNYKSYKGILAFDEPGLKHFNALKEMKDAYHQTEDKLFYINLLPMYATKEQLQNGATDLGTTPSTISEYVSYVEEFIITVKPKVLSYDFYPFINSFPNFHENYFTQMDIILSLSQKYRLPSWCFIQTCSFNDNTRIPNYTELLWQVNTSLAFGHTGIQYFTYFIPLEHGRETFKGSMIDISGQPTETYEHVKKINRIIKSFDILATLKIESIAFSNETKEHYNIPTQHRNTERFTAIAKNLLITLFTKDIEEHAFVMNLSLISPIYTILIDSKKGAHHEIQLEPAEARLIKL